MQPLGGDVLEHFEVHVYMVKEISSISIYKCFTDINSFGIGSLKKNYKMCSDWRWRDFVLNFAVCSADFYLRKLIQDPVSITRIAFKD